MIQVTKKDFCCGCSVCEKFCSKEAISMKPDALGFLYPEINQSKCVDCGICVKNCPVNIANKSRNLIQNSYAVINNDESVRMKSSSGGAFSLFAEKIISDGGIVFGAKFDADFNVVHGYTESIEELDDFRGSKYVQSDIKNSFLECKYFLDEGRKVLFSGTPCQCAGLSAFLNKDYENLILVDFVCHGVPSPVLWRKYFLWMEKVFGEHIKKVNFRDKKNGWCDYSLNLLFYDGSEYRQQMKYDKYLQIFLHDNALRESCYQCTAKGKERYSDITLADFWGIENVLPDFFDDKGTSLLCVNSEKGKKLFKVLMSKCQFKEVKIDNALKYNPAMIKSVIRPKKRDLFIKDLHKMNMLQLYKKYGRDKFSKRAYYFIKICVKKILGDNGTYVVKKILGKSL